MQQRQKGHIHERKELKEPLLANQKSKQVSKGALTQQLQEVMNSEPDSFSLPEMTECETNESTDVSINHELYTYYICDNSTNQILMWR